MEMKKKYYLPILLLICSTLFYCKKNQNTQTTRTYNVIYDSIPKKKKRVKILALKPKVKKKIDEVQSFSITSEYIDSLNIAPLNKVEEITYTLNENLEELIIKLDPSLKSKGVLSRIKQIETYSRAVNFEFFKNHRDTAVINKHLIKTIESFNNLITQLNETNTRLPEDFEKQLKKDVSIKKDSVEGVPLF